MIKLFLDDNIKVLKELDTKFDLIYADMIYENLNLEWVVRSFFALKEDGVLIIQTDYHTVANLKLYLDELIYNNGGVFINWVIYLQEWGGVPKKGFPRKHDDILIYAKSENFKWYPERIQIPKVTANTAFDKKGTGLKTPCDVFYDLGNFSTISKERIKLGGKNIQWQKPLKLMDRLLLPFTDEGDYILDPFMGSGTTGVWCVKNNRNFIGIESNKEIFEIAKERIDKI